MASTHRAANMPILVKTRSSRPLVSPSLDVDGPFTRVANRSPSLGGAGTHSGDVPVGFFRPVPSGNLAGDLVGDPAVDATRGRPSGGGSPSLVVRAILTGEWQSGCPEDAGSVSVADASSAGLASSTTGAAGPNMTTAICKRASRMARPADPSSEAMTAAVAIVNSRETVLRERGLERIASTAGERFKLAGASTGKGPAVKADTGDVETDITAQAKMNHVRQMNTLQF